MLILKDFVMMPKFSLKHHVETMWSLQGLEHGQGSADCTVSR